MQQQKVTILCLCVFISASIRLNISRDVSQLKTSTILRPLDNQKYLISVVYKVHHISQVFFLLIITTLNLFNWPHNSGLEESTCINIITWERGRREEERREIKEDKRRKETRRENGRRKWGSKKERRGYEGKRSKKDRKKGMETGKKRNDEMKQGTQIARKILKLHP